VLTVASFGLVSRGKSALCNALIGEKRWATGALHGVTRWPRSVRWQQWDTFDVDLVDTPGLDEVEGEERRRMTEAIVAEADLLLFVVNATLNDLEQATLKTLYPRKPLLLVFNKIDLYPQEEQPQILEALRQQVREVLGQQVLGQGSGQETVGQQVLEEIIPVVGVTADPQPQRVQLQWPDGHITEQWETPAPNIEPVLTALNQCLRTIALPQFLQQHRERGQALLHRMTEKVLTFYQTDRQRLQQRFWQGRMVWVALCPWTLADVAGAFLWDLLFLRNVSKLYGWPFTTPGVTPLWSTMTQNLMVLALGEWLGHIINAGDLSVLGTGGLSLGLVGSVALQALWVGYGGLRIADGVDRYFKQYGAGDLAAFPDADLSERIEET
jgi:small GTP-binding protein